MNILSVIKKAPSTKEYGQIVAFIGNNPQRFEALINIFLAGPYRLTQRVSGPINTIIQRNPKLVIPHLKRIIANHLTPEIHDAVKRNTIRMLQFVTIPAAMRGRVADICFNYLRSKDEPIAVRVFSMTVLFNLSTYHPEIKQELKILIEDMLPYASAGIQSRGKKILKALA